MASANHLRHNNYQQDYGDRVTWAMAAAEAILQAIGDNTPGRMAMLAGGKQEFARVAKTKLVGHGFRDADYELMWTVIRRRISDELKVVPS